MGFDDDAQTSGVAGPAQPTRTPEEPPSTEDAEVYDDDALAAALSEESVRLGYSGPISIIRPDPRPEPQQPAGLSGSMTSAPAPRPPEPVRPPEPAPTSQIPLADLPAPTGPPVALPPIPPPTEFAVAPPVVLPPPPHRESLPDAELVRGFDGQAVAEGSTANAMKTLEQQLRLRADEASAYRDWESRMLAIGTPEAIRSVEAARPGFAGVLTPDEGFLEFLEAAKGSDQPVDAAPTSGPYDLVEPSPTGRAPMEVVAAAPTWSSIVPSAADYPHPAETKSTEVPLLDSALGPLGTDSQPVSGPLYDVEPEDDVDETDRVPSDATGPFAVTLSGVAIAQPGAAVGPITPLETPRTSPAETVIPHEERQAPRAFAVEPFGVEPTAVDQRVGRAARLFWLWFSANSSVLSLAFGGILISLGVSLRQAIVAAFVGVAISFLPLGLGTLAGKWSGQPTMVASRATFGHVGNVLPAVLAVITRLFWGAVLLWLLAASTARILVGAGLGGPFSERQVALLAMALGFLIALVVAYFGYGLFARIQLGLSIVSALLIAGLVALTWTSVDITKALTIGDGPWILVVTGVVLVFSFVGLIWANSSADLARYQRPGTSGAASMLLAPFGTTLAPFLLIAYGAVLAASNPTTASGLARTPIDTIVALLPAWYPIPLLAATTLSLLSGVILSIYSGGFAVQATGLRVLRPWATVIVGALLFAIAMLLSYTVTDVAPLFRDVATTLAVPVAAWAGIFAAEMLIRRRRFDTGSLLARGGVYPAVNWVNLSMLVVATAIGLGFTSATVGWLGWEGYLFGATGVPLTSELGGTDIGVLIALALGVLTPLVSGVPTVRRQERARA
ncbi:purine-cytosine permease family protein [Lacisediminihabitans profunda]|uniref:Cytosine permease n=1 Tax=Lacisediminihabitans profunda TaxID=2594790 RepID=A0A5C8ULI6_9MICO|nr:cytosine permease [Lacisediminihabitans profunda]TXN29013.1 hypothetical protein FVP33_15995 [Lacisediminihabitans profunda]